MLVNTKFCKRLKTQEFDKKNCWCCKGKDFSCKDILVFQRKGYTKINYASI